MHFFSIRNNRGCVKYFRIWPQKCLLFTGILRLIYFGQFVFSLDKKRQRVMQISMIYSSIDSSGNSACHANQGAKVSPKHNRGRFDVHKFLAQLQLFYVNNFPQNCSCLGNILHCCLKVHLLWRSLLVKLQAALTITSPLLSLVPLGGATQRVSFCDAWPR